MKASINVEELRCERVNPRFGLTENKVRKGGLNSGPIYSERPAPPKPQPHTLHDLVKLSNHDKEQIEEFKLFQKQRTEYVNATATKQSDEQLFGNPYRVN